MNIYDTKNKYTDSINSCARRYNLDPDFIRSIIWAESRYNEKAKSVDGALGLMQLMPATAAGLDNTTVSETLKKDLVNGTTISIPNIYGDSTDVNYNIELGCRYLHQLSDKYRGNKAAIVAAYNSGPKGLNNAIVNYTKAASELTADEIKSGYRSNTKNTETPGFIDTVDAAYRAYSNGRKSLGVSNRATMSIFSPSVSTGSTGAATPSAAGSAGTIPAATPNEMPSDLHVGEYAKQVTIYPEHDDPDYFKIGDVVLKVPPQSISIQEMNASYSYPTVRTKGSPKIRTGQEDMMITVDCMFPRIVDINGYYDGDTWYGGLRSIIAHYYRIPFCPLENPTVRQVLFPSMNVPQDDTVNMGPRITNTDIEDKKVEVDKNDTVQKIITNMVGTTTDAKKDAAATKLVIEDVYEGFLTPDPIDTDTRSDDAMMAVVLDTININTVPGYPNALSATMTLRPFNYIPFSNDFSFLSTEEDVITQKDYYKYIWEGKNPQRNTITPTYNFSDCECAKKYYRGLLSEFVLQPGTEDIVYRPSRDTELLYPISDTSSLTSSIKLTYTYTTDTKQSILMGELQAAQASLPLVGKLSTDVNARPLSDRYYRPFTQLFRLWNAYFALVPWRASEIMNMMKQRIGIKDPQKFLFDPQKEQWVELEKYIDESLEALGVHKQDFFDEWGRFIDDEISNMRLQNFRTETIELDGPGRVVTGISATFRNKVAPIRPIGQIYPTYQYMGRSDVQFNISLQTTDESFLSEIRSMSSRSNTTQILATFKQKDNLPTRIDTAADVEGPIFQLLGVNKLIITDVTYSTVDEHPGLYNITMSAVSADMDIRNYEALIGQANISIQVVSEAAKALTNRNNITWSGDSRWEEISVDLYNASNQIDELEKSAKGNRIGQSTLDIENLFDRTISWAGSKALGIGAGTIVAPFAVGVLSSPLGIAVAVIVGKTTADRLNPHELSGDYIRKMEKLEREIYELIVVIKERLNEPSMKYVKSLGNTRIYTMVDQFKRKLDQRFNTAYGDMDLPALGGDPVDIPPDFFYRREDIITSDSIQECLSLKDRAEATKLLQSILMNFNIVKDQLPDDTTGWGQRFVELYSKPIPTNMEMDELRDMLMGVGLEADNPTFALSTINTIKAAVSMKIYEDKIVKAKEYRANAKGMSDSELDSLDTDIYDMERKLAEYRTPDGIMSQWDNAQVGISNWYGDSFSALERKEIERKAMESRKLERMLQMARAFPTIKLYFIEEDNAQWLLWDDFYSYDAIRSCDIVKSTEAASDTAVLRLSNISNNLTNPLADYQSEKWTLDSTAEEQLVDKLMLRVGCPIMILMGYDNNPMRLPMTFLGAVVEIRPGEGEVEIVAQGWGAQLNTPISAKEQKKDWWSMDKAHGDVLTWCLDQIPGLNHLGKKSIFSDEDDPIRARPRDVIFSRVINAIFETEMGTNDPRDDNIYFPYDMSWLPWHRTTFDWRIDPGQTAWEVIQEMLLWYPDWIATVLPYYPDPDRIVDRRLTLYVGPMDGYYKWTDKYKEDWDRHLHAVEMGVDRTLGGGGSSAAGGGASSEGSSVANLIDTAMNNKGVANGQEILSPEYIFLAKTVSKLIVRNSGGEYDIQNRFAIAHMQKANDILKTDNLKDEHGNVIEVHRNMLKDKDYNDRVLLHEIAHILTSESYIKDTMYNAKGYYDDPFENVARGAATMIYLNRNHQYNDILDRSFSSNINTFGIPADISSLTFGADIRDTEHPSKIWSDIEFNEIKRVAGIMSSILSRYNEYKYDPDSRRIIDEITNPIDNSGTGFTAPLLDPSNTNASSFPNINIVTTGKGDNEVLFSTMKYPAHKPTMFDPAHNLLKCFKPVVDYHFYDSDHHILDNSLTATTDNMYNRVILAYPGGTFSEPVYSYEKKKFDAVYEMSIDDDIKEDYIRSYVTYQKNIDTNWWVNCFMPMIPGRIKNSKEFKGNANGGIDETAGKVPRGIPQYIRVCNTILNNQCREMYNGNITVVGDPTVKPWDYIYIYDFQNEMSGPVQVKEVVHRFSTEGYTTTIKPMLISHCQNFQATLDTNYLGYTWTFGVVKGIINKTLLLPLGAHIATKAGAFGWGKLAAAAWAKGPLSTGIGKAIGGLGAKAVPYIGIAAWAWTAIDIARMVGLTFQKEFGRLMGRQPITITPITYAGKPLLAGVEGIRTDDMWVHTVDAISSIKDLPRSWIIGKATKGQWESKVRGTNVSTPFR